MSSSSAPAFDDGRPAGKPDDRPSSRIPNGWEHSPHSPDQFVLRCTECGILDRVDERAVAHDRANEHALDCDHSVGVTPIQQFGIETPALGDIATVTYNSLRSRNELEASGPVVGFELDDPDAPVFEVRIDIDGDRIIVARYSPLDDVARACLSVGTETQRLGTVIDVEYQPVMCDGGQSSRDTQHNDAESVRDSVIEDVKREGLRWSLHGAWMAKYREDQGEIRVYKLDEVIEDVDRGRGIETDGGRARDGQRSLDDARWSPDQMRLGDLDGDEDEEIDRGDGIETDGGRDGRYGRDYETEWGTIRMSDRSHCVGLLDLDDGLTQEFRTVRMNTCYLRDLVDMAELLGWDEMLLSVAPDKPVMARPEAMSDLALSAAPRINSGEADAEEEVNTDE